MTTHLRGFSTIFPIESEKVDRSILILNQLETSRADRGQYLIRLMDELQVSPKEAMVLITNWNGIKPKR